MIDVEHLNLIAIMRSEESSAALREVCSGMNGTKVDVHVASLQDIGRDKGLVKGRDVLLLDIDPRDPEEAERLSAIVQREFPATPVVVTAADVTIADIRTMMGLGVVGTGVAATLLRNKAHLSELTGRPVRLKKVLVRDVVRHRDIDLPSSLLKFIRTVP